MRVQFTYSIWQSGNLRYNKIINKNKTYSNIYLYTQILKGGLIDAQIK